METWDTIRARRNVREFTDRQIPEEALQQIMEAARRSPSSANKQRWDFVVCTDREQLERLATVWRGSWHVAGSAATIALVAPDAADPDERESIQYDLGQVTMSIMLAAADLGIGSAHGNVADQELARELLGFPEDRFCGRVISLGYPADRDLAPLRRHDRRAFDDVVHWGRW
jgi:nitroreductase